MMLIPRALHNLAVAALVALVATAAQAQLVAHAPTAREAVLLGDLQRPDNPGWKRVERQILGEWAKSGSASMDLLLQRGQSALEEDDIPAALDHLTALTDHAPFFAEGFLLRARAWVKAGRFGPAMRDLERALALNPNHFGALTGVASILAETGDTAGAIRAYEAALAIHPHLEQVRQTLDRLRQDLAGTPI